MTVLPLVIATMFLALFPFSVVFLTIFHRLSGAVRAVLILLWPLPGAVALVASGTDLPNWLIAWAMLSALTHAWRGLGASDAREWLGLMAVSAWPLLFAGGHSGGNAAFAAIALGVPLLSASLVVDSVERRFGAAHAALDLRLATEAPRLAGLFVVAVMSVAALPVSPSFFAMLSLLGGQMSGTVLTPLALLGVWFFWSWSGVRLIHAVVPGARRRTTRGSDLTARQAHLTYAALVAMGLAGLFTGGILI